MVPLHVRLLHRHLQLQTLQWNELVLLNAYKSLSLACGR